MAKESEKVAFFDGVSFYQHGTKQNYQFVEALLNNPPLQENYTSPNGKNWTLGRWIWGEKLELYLINVNIPIIYYATDDGKAAAKELIADKDKFSQYFRKLPNTLKSKYEEIKKEHITNRSNDEIKHAQWHASHGSAGSQLDDISVYKV